MKVPILGALFPADGAFHRMTPLDAAFLHAESARTPLHIGAISVFEGGPFFDERGELRIDAIRERISSRLHLVPRFRQRVATVPFGLDHPVWVDDDAFDITNHVKVMVLPEPGSRAQLAALAATLQMRLLDRSRPLWELWLVGGLDDGCVGLIEKVHHAMVDGVSGVEVAAALLDLEKDPALTGPEPWKAIAAPGGPQLALEALVHRLVQPEEWLSAAAALAKAPRRLLGSLVGMADLLGAEVVTHHRHTSLRQDVGHTRRIDWITVAFEPLHDASHALGVTVNDLILAAVTRGLRDLLMGRGEDVAGLTLQCLVPVDVRTAGEHGALGNRVAAISGSLPVGEDSVVRRLGVIHHTISAHKHHHEADGAELLMEGLDLVPPVALAAASKAIHHQPAIDVVVTNVPGPPCPLYFMGAEMLESVPVVPLGGNLPIGVAILSYNGALTIGVNADRAATPDLDVLMRGMSDELGELVTMTTW